MSHPQPEIVLTTDVVLFAIVYGELCILSIRRKSAPFAGEQALPGGYLRVRETSRHGATRVLFEKAGLQNMHLEQLYFFDEPGRDPRGNYCSISYLATCHLDNVVIEESESTAQPRFVPTKTTLRFDHNRIVAQAKERLRHKLQYTSIAATLLPEEFSLTDLQNCYEIVFETTFDKRNFRKKFLSLNLLEPTGNTRSGLKQRPAKLYRFLPNETTEIKKWF